MTGTLFERALNVAVQAHWGQTDKGGTPYIHHPIAVAANFQIEFLQAVGLLHDVVEDTSVTLDDLFNVHLFPRAVVDAVDCLTRRQGESYKAYINRIKPNSMARAVKIADIKHNLIRDRVADPAIRALLEKNRPMYYQALASLDHYEA